MDVRFSPEQQALRDGAGQVVDRLGPDSVAALDDTGRAGRLRAAVVASGWHELRHGTEGGAPVASGVEVAIVAEELSRGLADVAFLGPIMAGDLRRRAGAPMAAGAETVMLDPTLSWPATSVDGESPAGVAVDASGMTTALALVPDDSSGGWRLCHVPLIVAVGELDLTRPSTHLDRSATVTPVECRRALDTEDLSSWVALGLAITCADLVGVMRGAVELARSYAMDRRQFGVPIGSFQAVQHLLADAFVAMEGSRSVALYAAWAVDALPPGDAFAAGALAKAYCTRCARNVCEMAVQVHGGIGNTWDCLAHVFLRRALLSSELFGGADTNVGRVLEHHGVITAVGSGHGLR